MSFLSRLFGSKEPKNGPEDVDAALARLESDAEKARPGYVGSAYNKAGDLALKSGQEDRAFAYYGLAIDAFLEDMQREAARGVANKIIRVRPAAVRTLCTLTWLDLAAQHQATALLHLRDYVNGAKDAGQSVRAATQIYEMAKLSPDREFVNAVADALDSLDFSNRAKEVRAWTASGSPFQMHDPHAMSNACLTAAVRSNDRDAVLLTDEVEVATGPETTEPTGREEGPDGDDDREHPDTDGGAEADATAGPAADVEGDDDEHDEANHDEADDESSDQSGKSRKSRKSRKNRKKKR